MKRTFIFYTEDPVYCTNYIILWDKSASLVGAHDLHLQSDSLRQRKATVSFFKTVILKTFFQKEIFQISSPSRPISVLISTSCHQRIPLELFAYSESVASHKPATGTCFLIKSHRIKNINNCEQPKVSWISSLSWNRFYMRLDQCNSSFKKCNVWYVIKTLCVLP